MQFYSADIEMLMSGSNTMYIKIGRKQRPAPPPLAMEAGVVSGRKGMGNNRPLQNRRSQRATHHENVQMLVSERYGRR
jgi:hypothetical protein